MNDRADVRRLLVVAPPSTWIPQDGHGLGSWSLAVSRVEALEEAPVGSNWDVVAFHISALGQMDPSDTMDALRRVAPDATFLPVTDRPDPGEALYFLKHGSFEYLAEPLPAEEFLRALAEAIENRDTFQEILDLNRTLETQKEQLLAEKAELEKMNQELEAVSHLARALAATLDLDEILDQLSRRILDTVACSRLLVGLVDPEVPCEQTRLHLLVDEDGVPRAEPVDELCWHHQERDRQPWIGPVLNEGQTLQVADPANDPLTAGTLLAKLHRNPFVKLPLMSRGRVVGTVTVESRHQDQQIPSDELELLGIFSDTAAMALENARLYHSMRELSVRDELTGLYNRRHLAQQVEAEWQDADRRGNPLSLMMLDIDHFKALNDGNNHLVGDAALRKLATALLRNTRGVDTVARYGGEEFVVLLPRTPDDIALKVAEKLRQLVESSEFPGESAVPGGRLTISIGVAGRLPDDPEPRRLLERADWALYRAKKSGRNQVQVWEEEGTTGRG